MYSKTIKLVVVFINLVLLVVTNFLCFFTWHKILASKFDTMFLGLLLILLLIVTVYYLALIVWGLLMSRNINTINSKLEQSLVLFVMIVAPMITIYYFIS